MPEVAFLCLHSVSVSLSVSVTFMFSEKEFTDVDILHIDIWLLVLTRTFDLTRGLLPAAVDFGGHRNGLEQST